MRKAGEPERGSIFIRTIMRINSSSSVRTRYTRTIMRLNTEKTGVAAPPSRLVQQDAAALGRQVREARRRQGLDQKEVAFAAHVSPRTVFAIEKGKATVRTDMLIRVLAAVGLRLITESRDRAWSPGASRPR
jgi:HTH-type transcriptional regulator/antitoxin HipB